MQIELKVIKLRNISKHGLAMFCVVRDEGYFLPFLLDHYRRLGIEHFLFYDDASSDGSRELLEAQPDCSVVTSDTPYGAVIKGQVRYVHLLKQHIPRGVFGRRWVLTVDADEFLILPEPFIGLPELCEAIERAGGSSAVAALVDFYPERLNSRNYPVDISPFSVSRFCDRGPLFAWQDGRLRPSRRNVGIRYRLAQMLYQRNRKEYVEIFRGDLFRNGIHKGAKLWKVPLVNFASGHWVTNDHELNAPPFLGLQVALAHFKFYPGLDAKIAWAIESKGYFDLSRNYRMLERVLHYFGDKTLLCDQSVELRSRRDLEHANLMYPLRAHHQVPPVGTSTAT
jgi:hypothetical protein